MYIRTYVQEMKEVCAVELGEHMLAKHAAKKNTV